MAFLFIWLLSGALCAYIASEKGRSGGGWFLLGCFFGIFAIVAVCAVPKIGKKEE